MFLKYIGQTKDFKYKGFDFSNGPADVPDEIAKDILKWSPNSFEVVQTVVDVVEPESEPEVEPEPSKPAAKPAVKPAAKAK